tara:strand:+ start:837 stop:1382 length:546 start_codon:yes stop_codon:yes gene_type:complete
MNKNFVLTQDNLLSKKECDDLIVFFKERTERGEADYLNYEFCDIEKSPFMQPISHKITPAIEEYKKNYKEINLTASVWGFTNMRFKHFKPGYAFDTWHSEQSIVRPNRILSVQVYLSDHNCGTEFFNGDRVMSKAGRVTIFPAYFTHTHRGQKCPDSKDRYLLTGYYNYIKQGKKEYKGSL